MALLRCYAVRRRTDRKGNLLWRFLGRSQPAGELCAGLGSILTQFERNKKGEPYDSPSLLCSP